MLGKAIREHEAYQSYFSHSDSTWNKNLAEGSASPFTLYDVQCSISWSGYDYILTVRGGPSFKIYQQGEYSGRIVEYPETEGNQDWVKMVKLWSLNAGDCTFPFFPGVRDPAYSPHNHLPALHRMDGHLGPFDDTEHPQEFNTDGPWLPFIEPYSKEVEWANVLSALILEKDDICTVDETLVEDLLRRNFSLDLTLWRIKEKLRQRGVPNSNLPTFPPADTIRRLSGSTSYQHVLRRIVAIQRALRRKHACITYYSVPPLAGPDRHQPLSELFRGEVIPQANMNYMGLWGNALNREQLAWYHNVAKVPIYFSHELTTEEMAELIEHSTYAYSELNIFDERFLNSPYDSFAVEKAIGIVSDGQPSGACTSTNQTFESTTTYSSSRSQGYTEMREPRSEAALAQALRRLRDGYHDYEWEEDLFPGWHADVSSCFSMMVDRHRVSLVEAPQVAEVRLLLERWRHVFQVCDESILSDAQGTWCFVCAEKDDERFMHQKYLTWYDRTLSTVIHFTLPGRLAFPSGYILSDYHIETYGAPPPPWRVYNSADGAGQTLYQSLPLHWMYRHFEDSHSAGRTPPASDMTLLPFTDNPLNRFKTTFIPHGDGTFAAHVDAAVMAATPTASYVDASVMTTAPAAVRDDPSDGSVTAVDGKDKGKARKQSSTISSVEDPSNPTEQISSGSQSDRYNAKRSSANCRAAVLTISAHDLRAVALRLDALTKWELDAMKD